MVNLDFSSTSSTRLLEWSLSALHTSLFFWLFAIVLYLTGSLGNLLASLNTLVGAIIFVFLWVTTWLCTRQVVRQAFNPGAPSGIQIPPARILVLAMFWGGVNGVAFFLIPSFLAAIVAVAVTASHRLNDLPATVVILGFSLGIGSSIAFGVGVAFGLVFDLLDLLLLAASQGLVALNAKPTKDKRRTTAEKDRTAEPQ